MKKSNWRVRMEVKVMKEVYCENCTKEQATDSPWEYAINESELDQIDWDVISIEEDK